MDSRYWTDLIATGLLPLIALVALNYGIYVKIRKSVKFRENNDDKAGKRGSADTTMVGCKLKETLFCKLLLRKPFSLLFHQVTPLRHWLSTLKGFLTRHGALNEAIDSTRALLLELQRIKDTVSCAVLH